MSAGATPAGAPAGEEAAFGQGPRSRRFFVETWGCQMNELDSQRMSSQLMEQGILPTTDPADADVILLNSCSVREKAAQKAYSRLGEYRKLKRERPDLVLGFCGCVAQQEGETALRRNPDLDFVVGPGRVGELRAILGRRKDGERVVATGFPDATDRSYELDALSREGLHKGMVTIIEGCDKKCTFCIVPQTRGPEQSRRMGDVLAEVRHLLDLGFVEIELLGQTVNHWRDPDSDADFADLLDAVARIPGLRRLRFVTSYPRDFSSRMVEQIGRHPNICPYLHLPVQSGSDRILKWMGRGYDVALYRDLAARLRAARPELAISTDIIVGFPGESDEDFDASVALVEDVRFAALFAFKYSPRPGTAAPRLPLEEVPEEVAGDRLQRLLDVQRRIQLELNAALVGSRRQVLVTGPAREEERWTGRTDCHRLVHFEAPQAPPVGTLVEVEITRAMPHSLFGGLVAATASRPPAGEGRPLPRLGLPVLR